jgi:hypothetical protein
MGQQVADVLIAAQLLRMGQIYGLGFVIGFVCHSQRQSDETDSASELAIVRFFVGSRVLLVRVRAHL